MANALLQVQWEPCVLEPARDAGLEQLVRDKYGMVPPHVPYLVPCPWLVRAIVHLNPDSGNLAHLDHAVADLVSFVVSQENSCRFCFAFSRWLLRVQGLSEERIDELSARLAAGTLDPRSAAAATFARRMARSQPVVTAADVEPLRAAGFDAAQIREIGYVVAYTTAANRLTTIPAIPPHGWEKAADRWYFALLRPLMARAVSRTRWHGQPAAAPAVVPAGVPFARLVAGLGRLPVAANLAVMLAELWASPVLPRRSKALLFAVVGTGLGCSQSLDDARRVLREEGVDDATVERALTHLQAPGLDAAENLMLGFARDSVWYTPVQVQRRARDVREALGPARFVEALGIVSLANALCRLTPVVFATA